MVEGNKVIVTCSSEQGSYNFTGIPQQWPTDCRDVSDTCTIPTPLDDSNMNAQPQDTAAPKVGETLTYTCKDSLTLDNDEEPFNITCKAFPTEADPWYEVKFDENNPETWPKCSSSRKKRQIVPRLYQYINVVIDVQFKSPNLTTFDDVE